MVERIGPLGSFSPPCLLVISVIAHRASRHVGRPPVVAPGRHGGLPLRVQTVLRYLLPQRLAVDAEDFAPRAS